MKIVKIEITYEDGSYYSIDNYALKQLEHMADVIRWIERAKAIYEDLSPLFSKEKK